MKTFFRKTLLIVFLLASFTSQSFANCDTVLQELNKAADKVVTVPPLPEKAKTEVLLEVKVKQIQADKVKSNIRSLLKDLAANNCFTQKSTEVKSTLKKVAQKHGDAMAEHVSEFKPKSPTFAIIFEYYVPALGDMTDLDSKSKALSSLTELAFSQNEFNVCTKIYVDIHKINPNFGEPPFKVVDCVLDLMDIGMFKKILKSPPKIVKNEHLWGCSVGRAAAFFGLIELAQTNNKLCRSSKSDHLHEFLASMNDILVFIDQKKYDEAKKIIETLKEKNLPKLKKSIVVRLEGKVALAQGKYKEAEDLFKSAIQMNNDANGDKLPFMKFWFYMNLVHAAYLEGDRSQFKASMRSTREILPKNNKEIEHYYNLINIWEKVGEGKKLPQLKSEFAEIKKSFGENSEDVKMLNRAFNMK